MSVIATLGADQIIHLRYRYSNETCNVLDMSIQEAYQLVRDLLLTIEEWEDTMEAKHAKADADRE